jgi:hypothetical protein
VERRASARALTLPMSRWSEAAECLRSPEPAMPELEISWASEEREEHGDDEKEQEEEPEEEKEKEPSEEPAEEQEKPQEEEEKNPEEEDELLLCPEEPESRKEPEREVEELKGEKKKLELPLPEPNEEEREREYQQMIDKLNNTKCCIGKRKKKKDEIVEFLRKGSPMQYLLSDWISIFCMCFPYCNSSLIKYYCS